MLLRQQSSTKDIVPPSKLTSEPFSLLCQGCKPYLPLQSQLELRFSCKALTKQQSLCLRAQAYRLTDLGQVARDLDPLTVPLRATLIMVFHRRILEGFL